MDATDIEAKGLTCNGPVSHWCDEPLFPSSHGNSSHEISLSAASLNVTISASRTSWKQVCAIGICMPVPFLPLRKR